ncbi:MAG: hypothetical protein HUU54_09000 [Ignavibacteriaceae bacterium]|nr:hypothetical protein [Ignavibacteriaceae bacterium]
MSLTPKEIKFEEEIKILNGIYSDMLEAIHAKPDTTNVEELNNYFGNVYGILNRTALRVKDIKNLLERDKKFIHETWNAPA